MAHTLTLEKIYISTRGIDRLNWEKIKLKIKLCLLQTIPRRGMQCWQITNSAQLEGQNGYLDLKDRFTFESGMTICGKMDIQVEIKCLSQTEISQIDYYPMIKRQILQSTTV